MQGPIDSIVLTGWDDPKVQHAVNHAFMEMKGEWDATDEASRGRLIALIRDGGFPDVDLTYDPAEGKVSRVYIWPKGRSQA